MIKSSRQDRAVEEMARRDRERVEGEYETRPGRWPMKTADRCPTCGSTARDRWRAGRDAHYDRRA